MKLDLAYKKAEKQIDKMKKIQNGQKN
jgi:hypothetical protein